MNALEKKEGVSEDDLTIVATVREGKIDGPEPTVSAPSDAESGTDGREKEAPNLEVPPRYNRLFTDEELDAMEYGIQNAESANGPSLEDMAEFLGVSVEVLEQRQDAAPEVASCVTVRRVSAEAVYETFGLSEVDPGPESTTVPVEDGAAGLVSEGIVSLNIVVPLGDWDSEVAARAPSPAYPATDTMEPTVDPSSREKAMASMAVYLFLKEKSLGRAGIVETPSVQCGTADVPPFAR
ncbi:uncharacterized protein IUM83_12765 [Phytophthora cinnamomi]|uniref:uncharacterized protein n=1 Tax=Phytophthora cinnamomi TaxID=4785 RepID=UPI003559FF43|nr:hypothetical protein IUM83_12765 [Phytophthora cinnamomi]